MTAAAAAAAARPSPDYKQTLQCCQSSHVLFLHPCSQPSGVSYTLAAALPPMWEWLLWGTPPKLRPKQLGDVVERLLAAGSTDGENAFTLPEKELKRLCSAAR